MKGQSGHRRGEESIRQSGLRLSDRFGEEARKCSSPEDLRQLLEDAAKELGFRFFALLHHRSVSRPSDGLIRLDNYPGGWEEELLDRHDVASDPVHLASLRTNAGFEWGQLDDILPLSLPQRHLLEQSRRHGWVPVSPFRPISLASRPDPVPSSSRRAGPSPSAS